MCKRIKKLPICRNSSSPMTNEHPVIILYMQVLVFYHTPTLQYKYPKIRRRLLLLDALLGTRGIGFYSLGPSTDPRHTSGACSIIVTSSGRFSCSAGVKPGDIDAARAAAECAICTSTLDDDNDGDHMRGVSEIFVSVHRRASSPSCSFRGQGLRRCLWWQYHPLQ